MVASHIVRGYGPLDMFLAKQRYKIAKKQINSVRQRERILDIGCGSYPLFLTTVDFSEKYGMDKMVQTNKAVQGITLINYDFKNEEKLPFQSGQAGRPLCPFSFRFNSRGVWFGG